MNLIKLVHRHLNSVHGSLHFIGFTSGVRGHIDRLEYGQLRLVISEKDANLRPVAQNTHKIYICRREILSRLKFQQDKLISKVRI